MIDKITGWFTNSRQALNDVDIDLVGLYKTIKYEFKDRKLIIQALSHRSFYIEAEKQLYSNERLEFLGDAVLDLITTDFLFGKFKKENEGLLSQKKAILVSRKVLGKITSELGLGQYLILNKGEEKTGGRDRLSNLANLFEAILGAIYLDGGLKPSQDFVNHFLISRQKELLRAKSFFNYKSALLEFAQSKGWGAPQYRVIKESGPDHQKFFVIEVNANSKWSASGEGSNKKTAEQNAAKQALGDMSVQYNEINDILKS